MTEIKFSRRELYELVWSEPMTSISKKYKISDVGMRKICLKMLVPIPEKGYWRKIRTGQSISIPPLVEEQTIILSLRKEEEKVNPVVTIKKEIENDITIPLVVPTTLIAPDPLIVDFMNDLKKQKTEGIISNGWGKLDINVTRENIDRALLFLDTLIKILRARGHNVLIEGSSTYAVIEEEKIKISIREKLKKVPVNKPWQTIEYLPAGTLSFTFKAGIHFFEVSEWKDGKLPFESRLSKILAEMEFKAKKYKTIRIQQQKEKEEEEENKRIELELEERQDLELANFTDLLNDSARWQKATILRNYINKLESQTVALERSAEFKVWLTWAKKKVDWYDPLIESEDELLADFDRNEI